MNMGGTVAAHNAGATNLPTTWVSGEFFTSVFLSPATIRITGEHSDSVPATVKIYANGGLRDTVSAVDSEPVRLAPTQSANAWTVEISSSTPWYEFRVSTSIEELLSGV